VAEVKALKNIDVAFMPLNIPLGRMTPAASAACVRELRPRVVYVYHYDQDYASRAVNPRATPQGIPGGLTVAQSLEAFKQALEGSGVEVRLRDWYSRR
jgi:L-ascorbate metabolism protein UlaG (beta-lactamase superfamily)